MRDNDYLTKETQLKSYKGYEIWKYEDYYLNKKYKTSYEVCDNDDNSIDLFDTLAKAKKYIDTVLN